MSSLGNYFSQDSIAAIATSLAGDAGVGIIRISGANAVAAAKTVSSSFDLSKPRYLQRIEVKDPKTNEILDDGLVVYFPKDCSFTGEEVIELQLHGGRFLLQTILRLLVSSGLVRLALPGEFTFRAVRNGKMNLSEATKLKQIISAKSGFEIKAAHQNLSAKRLEEFQSLANEIRNLLAQTELSIDFIDQDVEVVSLVEMKQRITALISRVNDLLTHIEIAQKIAQGVQVTLLGAPNVGKSTLFNAILSEDRAIVSPEPGTTRDVITEKISIGPYYIQLADTAGLREEGTAIEKEGMKRTKNQTYVSDLVLVVVDASLSLSGLTIGSQDILVLNKWDKISDENRKKILNEVKSITPTPRFVCVSALREQGISDLLSLIQSSLDVKFDVGSNSFLPTEFQLQMLIKCKEMLAQGSELLSVSGLKNPELLSISLKGAAQALANIVGETTPDTVLTKIFSEFCIGK